MTKLKHGQPFLVTGSIDKVTGLTVIPDLNSPGFLTQVTGFEIISAGTAWNEATGIKILDGAGVVFATIVKAALAGSNAIIHPWTSGVTVGAGWAAGGTVGSTLVVSPYGTTETTGTNPTITIWGVRF